MLQPSENATDQGDGGRPRLNWRRTPLWFWLALTLLTLGWNIWSFSPHEAQAAALPYSSFLEQVRAGNVVEVEIVGQEVQGTLKGPIPWSPEGEPEPAQHDTFVTSLPPLDDQRLLPLLDEQGVTVISRPPSTP